MTDKSSRGRSRLRISGARSSALDVARGRLALVSVCFVLAYVIVLARVFDLSVIEGELAGYEYSVYERSAEVADNKAAPRGDIVDRHGVLLATSLKTASLYADPSLVQDPKIVAEELVTLFPDLTYGDVLQKLQREGRFVWIKRNITPQEQKAVLQIGSPALEFREEYSRIYPQGRLASHIVGTTNIDGRGVSGIEASFDGILSEPEKSLDNQSVMLTLDTRLQYALRREMVRAKDEFSAIAGAGMVFDITSGEILAAVSLPDFDPHDPGAAQDQDNNPMFNRVSLGVYELGSMFKIFSTAAYLDTFDVGLGHSFDASKPIQRGRFKISDYHAEGRELTIPEVFMYSSNIGSALMGEELGNERLKNFYRDLGLFDKASLEINEIGTPLLPNPWRDINTITASYGHGIAVSPLQMMVAASSIVNGGTRVRPRLVRYEDKYQEQTEISSHYGLNDPYQIRVVSSQTAHRMRQLLRLVVTDGTAKMADVPGYSVGGKTGTAEKIGAHGYDKKRLMSSFVGFFPMEEPRYGVLIVIDEPKGNKQSFGYATAGWVAAPAAGRVINSMAAILGIPAQHTAGDDVAGIAESLRVYISDEKKKGAR